MLQRQPSYQIVIGIVQHMTDNKAELQRNLLNAGRSNIRISMRRGSVKQEEFKSYKSTVKYSKLQMQMQQNELLRIKAGRTKVQRNIRSNSMIPSMFAHKKFYYISKGNNHTLVSSILELDEYESTIRPQNASLIWLQDNRKYEYSFKKPSTWINMFEFHHQLTEKDKLYTNMKALCRAKGLDINEVMPTTFIIDFESPYIKAMVSQFLKYYIANHPNKQIKSRLKGHFEIEQLNFNLKVKYKDIIMQLNQQQLLKPQREIHSRASQEVSQKDALRRSEKLKQKEKPSEQQKYVWMLKPANLNRGRCIKLFSKLKQLRQLLTENDLLIAYKMYTESHKQAQTRYVIQRYVHKPLLISGRKFDIRVWVFVDPNLQCFFFKEGYLRLSGYNYSVSKQSINNLFIHLTNNAIQKNSEAYGTHEQGNQLSFADFQSYLSQNTTIKYQQIVTRMSLEATLLLVNEKLRKNCFQLLGYDFLVDQQGHLWLIQCNSNPCLQESSQLLCRLIPLLIKECFKIVKGEFNSLLYFQRIL